MNGSIIALSVCFNPRLPGGRRRLEASSKAYYTLSFQSTPSGGKATGALWIGSRMLLAVSIHAFRGEGDRAAHRDVTDQFRFNPRLPGGRRRGFPAIFRERYEFQSTPSGGKATVQVVPLVEISTAFQSTPSGGKATSRTRTSSGASPFQSTPSGGKATASATPPVRPQTVSIHAFRGEGDSSSTVICCSFDSFNPRLPGGRRLVSVAVRGAGRRFNPRLPGGRRRDPR